MNIHDAPYVLGVMLLIFGAAVAVLEMHTLTIYMIAIAMAFFVGGGLGVAGFSVTVILTGVALTLLVALPLAHYTRQRLKNKASDEVSQDDVGKLVQFTRLDDEHNLRVSYRGSTWSARMKQADFPISSLKPGQALMITARAGNTLMLEVPASLSSTSS